MSVDELKGRLVGLLDFFRIAASESVFTILDGDESVGHLMFGQFLGHHGRLFIGHVGVSVAVNEQGGGIVWGHIPDRHEGVEFFRLGVGIEVGNGLWPRSVLSTVLINGATIAHTVGGVGDGGPGKQFGEFVFGDLDSLVPGMWARAAIPRSDEIAIAIETY